MSSSEQLNFIDSTPSEALNLCPPAIDTLDFVWEDYINYDYINLDSDLGHLSSPESSIASISDSPSPNPFLLPPNLTTDPYSYPVLPVSTNKSLTEPFDIYSILEAPLTFCPSNPATPISDQYEDIGTFQNWLTS